MLKNDRPPATPAAFLAWNRPPATHYADCVAAFKSQLYALNSGLTNRELSVCALALAGVTIDGSALELNVKRSSIITYRKRAYERLQVSSLNEIFGILAFASAKHDINRLC
jgi:DNA-binding CsgD family transcriptional regulator